MEYNINNWVFISVQLHKYDNRVFIIIELGVYIYRRRKFIVLCHHVSTIIHVTTATSLEAERALIFFHKCPVCTKHLTIIFSKCSMFGSSPNPQCKWSCTEHLIHFLHKCFKECVVLHWSCWR